MKFITVLIIFASSAILLNNSLAIFVAAYPELCRNIVFCRRAFVELDFFVEGVLKFRRRGGEILSNDPLSKFCRIGGRARC